METETWIVFNQDRTTAVTIRTM